MAEIPKATPIPDPFCLRWRTKFSHLAITVKISVGLRGPQLKIQAQAFDVREKFRDEKMVALLGKER